MARELFVCFPLAGNKLITRRNMLPVNKNGKKPREK